MTRHSRDSRIVKESAVLMRILHQARTVGSVVDEDWVTVFIEADESGSILQSRISTY